MKIKRFFVAVFSILAITALGIGLSACGDGGKSDGNNGVQSSDLSQDPSEIFVYNGKMITGLTEYGKTLTDIIIPNKIEDVPITGIDSSAFKNCDNLKKVVISKGIKRIGASAFADCDGLITVTTDDYIDNIDSYQIKKSDSLASTIASSRSLSKVNISDDESSDENGEGEEWLLEAEAFKDCDNLTSVVIPDGIRAIQSGVFAQCKGLEEIILPDSVIYLTEWSFVDCKSLKSIVLSDNIKKIPSYTFQNCESLTKVVLPKNVTKIYSTAFEGCNSLEYNMDGELQYLGSSDNPYLYLMGIASTDITKVTIHKDCKVTKGSVFSGCNKLTSIELPDGMENIANGLLGGCKGLTEVVIPNSVTSIEEYAFSGCSGLTEIVLPDGVTSIGEYAFSGCSSLTEIIIPDGVTSIGYGAFHYTGCYQNIDNWQNDVLYIGKYLIEAKQDISGSHTIKQDTLCIADQAFEMRSELTKIVISDSVISIGKHAFFCCGSLTEIVLPNSLKSIDENAFRDCMSLESITFKGTVEEWNAVEKKYHWNHFVPAREVVCSDGTVAMVDVE